MVNFLSDWISLYERIPCSPLAAFAPASVEGAEFSAYDEQGGPTHDKEGNALPKSAMKKLAKDRGTTMGRYGMGRWVTFVVCRFLCVFTFSFCTT